jgi:hypothetical protein
MAAALVSTQRSHHSQLKQESSSNMVAPNFQPATGQVVDLQTVIDDLERQLGPWPWRALCEAIDRGDEQAIHEQSLLISGKETLIPKKLAIEVGRPDVLRMLLERDGLFEDDMVVAACERQDRTCIRILMDFGWPIEQPICDASVLWSVLIFRYKVSPALC